MKSVSSLIRVTSGRIVKDAKTLESRNYISSLEHFDAERALAMTRSHWPIENRLHSNLDVSFRDHECRVYAANAAENLVVVRHIALNLLRSVKGVDDGIASRRMQSAYDDTAREGYSTTITVYSSSASTLWRLSERCFSSPVTHSAPPSCSIASSPRGKWLSLMRSGPSTTLPSSSTRTA